MAGQSALLAASAVVVLLLSFPPTLVRCSPPHGTHWKAGAGVWHPHEEPMPTVARGGQQLANDEAVTLTVEPAIVSVGDSVTVSWDQKKSVLSPTEVSAHGDIIAAYCPETAADHDYIDYHNVTVNSTSKVGFGPLVNMRCRYQFRYLRILPNGSYEVTAQSAAVPFHQGTSQPTQGRISETGTAGEMNVMWVSDLADTSMVQYYATTTTPQRDDVTNDDVAVKNATGTSHTYAATDLCNAPANETAALKFRDPGHIHLVTLADLAPGTQYEYRYGTDLHWSVWYRFTTQAVAGSNAPVRFFVFGDLGEWRNAAGRPPGDRAYTTMGRIQHDLEAAATTDTPYDMLLHVGDISYARGLAYQWEQFGDLVQNVSTRIPYYVGIGNHEYDHVAGGTKDPSGAAANGYHPSWGNYGSDSGGECAVPVVNRFTMPRSGPASGVRSNAPFWYSHSRGLVHMVWLSTEHDFYPGSEQHTFLVAELESVNRTLTPWLFVLGHRPMYTSSRYSTANYIVQTHQREAYEDVLQKYGVDVFWGGHYHSYERTCAVYQEKCRETKAGNPLATVHIMVGMAGASHGRPVWRNESWAISHYIDYGYNRVLVANATHLLTEYVENEKGEVKDSAWIVSDHRWQDTAEQQWGRGQ